MYATKYSSKNCCSATKKKTDKQTDREADTQQTNKEEHIKINYCIYIYKCVCACNYIYIYIYIKHYKRSSPHSRDCQPHTNHRMHSTGCDPFFKICQLQHGSVSPWTSNQVEASETCEQGRVPWLKLRYAKIFQVVPSGYLT